MAQPFVGEIRIIGGTYAPSGWMLCDGQLLPIEEYVELFSLIGTTYGGDGTATFALPDLRGRVPVGNGTGQILGASGGAETVAVSLAQLPAHAHTMIANTAAGGPAPTSAVLGSSAAVDVFREAAPDTTLAAATVAAEGGSGAHENLQPYRCVNFMIAYQGIVPTAGKASRAG